MTTTIENKTELEELAFSTPGQPSTELQKEAFFLAWNDRIWTTVKNALPEYTPEDHEDAVQRLLMRWFEDDWLAKYDPEKGMISTFVYNFVNTRLKAIRRDLKKVDEGHYEGHSMRRVYQSEERPFDRLVDALSREHVEIELDPDAEDELEDYRLFVEVVTSRLEELSHLTQRDLVKLWLAYVEFDRANEGKLPQQRDIAKATGLTDPSVSNWKATMKRLMLKNGIASEAPSGRVVWTITS